MILTGKCREGFEKWLRGYYELTRKDYDKYPFQILLRKFYRKTSIEQNALIIDYFSTLKYKGQDFWLYVFDAYYKIKIESMTINDVNIQAIEKANEILNKEL
jgi:hypothetical protein